METFQWKCPFCNHYTTITEYDLIQEEITLTIDNKHGGKKLEVLFIVCPNPKCREFSLYALLHNAYWDNGWRKGKLIKKWSLIPPSKAKKFPNYIPEPIIQDYEEACLIKDLSPKAAATLARRCIQGIIRDFFGVKKNRLIDEIEAIKDKIDPLTWDAIDSVRKIGNIGAHMEKDINKIIEIEPGEADLLIQLIETLFEDLYIAKYEREKRLQKIIEIKEKKEREKKNST